MASSDSGDSRLSIAANVISIFTFAYAIVASIYLYIYTTATLLHESEREMHIAAKWVQGRKAEAMALRSSLDQRSKQNERFDYQRIDSDLREIEKELAEVDSRLKYDRSSTRKQRFADRARWIAGKEVYNTSREKVEKSMAEVKEFMNHNIVSPEMVTMLRLLEKHKDFQNDFMKEQSEINRLLNEVLDIVKYGQV